MNILIYLPYLNQTSGGTKQYSIALVNTLSQDISNKYYILNYDNNTELIDIINHSKNLKLLPKYITKEYFLEKIVFNFVKAYNIIVSILQLNIKLLNFSFLDRVCFFYRIDLVHCPFQYAPYTMAKTLWTLHDVQELHFPQYFTPTKREQRARTWNDSLKRADHVIVSFEHVKKDIQRYFDYNSVSVAFIDMKFLWISKYIDTHGKYVDLSSNYLVYAANTWEHKNHIGLIKSVKYIKDKFKIEISIVFVGHKTNF
jgi:hypothetical protein